MGVIKGKAIETEEKDKIEAKELDIDSLLALDDGEDEEQDLEANPNDKPTPIPPGEYIFKIIFNPQKKVTSKAKKDGPTSYTIPITAVIEDKHAGELNGRRIDYYANTSKGYSPISRTAYLLKQLGVLNTDKISQEAQAKMLVLALKQEPKIKGIVNWEASYVVEEEGEKKYKIGKYKGKRLDTSENFPVIDNELQHEVEIVDDNGENRSVMARPYIEDWIRKVNPISLPTLSTKKIAKKDDEDSEENEKPKSSSTTKKKIEVADDV